MKATTYINTFVTSTLLTAPPSGGALIYQAFALQGLVNAINYINEQITSNSNLLTMLFADFLSLSQYAENRMAIANYLTTSYDAFGAIGLFNTSLEAKGLCYRMYLTCLQLILNNPTVYISATGDQRIVDFLE